jgi:hypothetical protein
MGETEKGKCEISKYNQEAERFYRLHNSLKAVESGLSYAYVSFFAST